MFCEPQLTIKEWNIEGHEGGEGTNLISQFIFFQIPLRNSQIPFPFLILTFFSHSQWQNPSPSVAWTLFSQGKTCQSQFPIYPFKTLYEHCQLAGINIDIQIRMS